MNQKTAAGLQILAASVLLGLLGNALLRATPWGLNAALWTAALVLAMILLARRQERPASPDTRWLAPCLLLFGAALAWRDSPVLKTLDALALLALLTLAVCRTQAGRVHLAAVTEYPLAALRTMGQTLLGSVLLLGEDIRWRELPRDGWGRHLGGLLRGLLMAGPLLLLFGGLFMAADPVFQRLVLRAFQWDCLSLADHLFLTACCAWLTGGYLRWLFLVPDPAPPAASPPAEEAERSRAFSLGTVELVVVLGLLNALFLSFVLIQVRYFFGGAALVQSAIPLTYAEYARRGFFELVTVAALMLPLLLTFHWLQDAATARTRIFPLLAGSLVAQLFVIMGSALMRMRLYQLAYGLTELRVYTTAFMLWLAVLFVWFGLTVMRGRRERFSFGSLVAGLLFVLGLHVLNPDALIVRANAARDAAGRFDVTYALSLSADAVPALASEMPRLRPETRRVAAAYLAPRRVGLAHADWRAWSWSRWQARRALESLLARKEEGRR